MCSSSQALAPISQSAAARLKPGLSYKHLKRGYFIVRSNILHTTPFYSTRVAAGSPSNVEELEEVVEQHLDLNEHLVGNSTSVFCIRVEGDSMTGASISDNDILIVDRSSQPVDGSIVIASINSELTVKRLKYINNQIMLVPENPHYEPIEITDKIDFKIWGVVIHVIHSLL